MPDSDDDGKSARDARMANSRKSAQKALDAIRKARVGFLAANAAAVVTQQLTPDPSASLFRTSTLHEALRPFTQLGAICDIEQP